MDGPRGFKKTVQKTESERSFHYRSIVANVHFHITVHFHLIRPSSLELTRFCGSLKKLYSRALLLAVDFEFEHGVNYLLNNKKNFFNITDLTSELILLDEVSI